MTDYWLKAKPVDTHNRFNPIAASNEPADPDKSNEPEEMDTNNDPPQEAKKEPRPPPIFVYGVEDIMPLQDLLLKEAKGQYSYKSLNDGEVKIQMTTADDYRAVMRELRAKGTELHSYQFKKDRAFRVVLKGIHHSVKTDDIKAELAALGHNVQSIVNVKHGRTKMPLSMFYVNLERKDNNKNIYEIIRLLHFVVEFQAPRAKKELPQCTRCQHFGHTKSFCTRSPRCVKCLGDHLTTDCRRKTRDDAVRCANCGGAHPANYRGCEVHKQLQEKYFPRLREKTQARTGRVDNQNQNNFTNPTLSYADALNGNNDVTENPPNNPSTADNSGDMSEIKQMMKIFMEQYINMVLGSLGGGSMGVPFMVWPVCGGTGDCTYGDSHGLLVSPPPKLPSFSIIHSPGTLLMHTPSVALSRHWPMPAGLGGCGNG
uniref:Putative nucleic-acid-binding protein from transposon x-element n=1 Tax=Lutzomyia longipalpis TaxID=7200 RepID=A0A1B0CIJ5_LUTLO